MVSGVRAPELAHRERAIHSLPEAEFIAELRRLNGTPDKILENPELMEIMLPLLRADFALYEKYAMQLNLHWAVLSLLLAAWMIPEWSIAILKRGVIRRVLRFR